MSVFDENRTKCTHCGDYINHWEQSSNDFHDTGICAEAKRKKEQKLAERIAEMNRLTTALRLVEHFEVKLPNFDDNYILEKAAKEGTLRIYPATIRWELAKDYDYLLDLEYTLADI